MIKVSLVDQILSTITIPLSGVPIGDMLSNLTVILATATVTFVFYFTSPREGILKYVTLIGRFFLMTYLGFQFAGAIMMRESVLISQLSIILSGEGIWLIPLAFVLLAIGIYYDWNKGQLHWMG